MRRVERRHYLRIPTTDLHGHLKLGNEVVALGLSVADVSPGGLFLRSESLLPVGTTVGVELWRPGSGLALQVTGRVVRACSLATAGGPHMRSGLGIRFESLPEDTRERLQRLIEQLAADARAPALAPELELPPTLLTPPERLAAAGVSLSALTSVRSAGLPTHEDSTHGPTLHEHPAHGELVNGPTLHGLHALGVTPSDPARPAPAGPLTPRPGSRTLVRPPPGAVGEGERAVPPDGSGAADTLQEAVRLATHLQQLLVDAQVLQRHELTAREQTAARLQAEVTRLQEALTASEARVRALEEKLAAPRRSRDTEALLKEG